MENTRDEGGNTIFADHNTNPLSPLGIPFYVANKIWNRAQELQNGDNIVTAPGVSSVEASMVASSRGLKPHYVQLKNCKYLCDKECIQFQCMKICSHVVAVAQKSGRLDEYLRWYRKNHPQPNMTTLAESGLPKASIGKKPAKRKGVSRKTSAEIQNIIAETDESPWSIRESLLSQSVPTTIPSAPNPCTTSANSTTPTSTQQELLPPYAPNQGLYSLMPYPSSQYPPRQYPPSPYLPSQYLPSQYLPSQYPPSQYPPSQYSPTPYLPMASQYLDPLPSNSYPPSTAPFYLTLLQGNVRKCYGCGGSYKKPAIPPYNLVIQHAADREFFVVGSPVVHTKHGNCYYHLSSQCVQKQVIRVEKTRGAAAPRTRAVFTLHM